MHVPVISYPSASFLPRCCSSSSSLTVALSFYSATFGYSVFVWLFPHFFFFILYLLISLVCLRFIHFRLVPFGALRSLSSRSFLLSSFLVPLYPEAEQRDSRGRFHPT